MSTKTKSPSEKAAKGGKGRNKQKSGLTVIGYVVRNNERIRRDSLPSEEQQRLAEAWSIKAMESIGYEPTHSPDYYIPEHGEGVAQ